MRTPGDTRPSRAIPDRLSRRAGFVIGAAALFMAVVSTVQSYTAERMQSRPDTLVQVAVPAFALWGTWLLLAPLVVRLAAAMPPRRGRLHVSLPLHLLAASGCGTIVTGVVVGVDRIVIPSMATTPFVHLLLSGFLYQYHLHLFVYAALLLGHEVHAHDRRVAEQVRSALELRAALVDAQLAALQDQLQPHFLFNTLHAVGALIEESPEAARRMVARIGDLLRATLDSGGTNQVPLSHEFDLLRLYLEIEEVRFQDRLTVTIDVAPDVEGAAVPPFVLQPLVENAVRYGIARRSGSGTIRVSARREGEQTVMEVWNDNSELPAPRHARRRASQYGGAAAAPVRRGSRPDAHACRERRARTRGPSVPT